MCLRAEPDPFQVEKLYCPMRLRKALQMSSFLFVQ